MQTNFGFGRSFFVAGGTVEVKIFDTRNPDKRGMFVAEIRNLVTGKKCIRPVKIRASATPRWMSPETGVAIEIH